MVYNIENRILYRGFHPCTEGKEKIRKNDGKEVKGKWLVGQMVEVISSATAEPSLPLICLAAPNQKIRSITDHTVCPATMGLYSGIYIHTNWNDPKLAKAWKDKWQKKHPNQKWNGLPVFEGDIFRCPWDKKLYVLLWDLLNGFYLTPVNNPGNHRVSVSALTLYDYQYKGNLWQPSMDIEEAWINAIHKLRGVELREDELQIYI